MRILSAHVPHLLLAKSSNIAYLMSPKFLFSFFPSADFLLSTRRNIERDSTHVSFDFFL